MDVLFYSSLHSFIYPLVLGSIIYLMVHAVAHPFTHSSFDSKWFFYMQCVGCDGSHAICLAFSRHFSKRGLRAYIYIQHIDIFKSLFLYLFLDVLVLHGCMGFSLVEWGLLSSYGVWACLCSGFLMWSTGSRASRL